jgi:hypothetical protein
MKWILMAVVLALCSAVNAATLTEATLNLSLPHTGTPITLMDNVTVNATAVVYTKQVNGSQFSASNIGYFWYLCTSATGTASVAMAFGGGPSLTDTEWGFNSNFNATYNTELPELKVYNEVSGFYFGIRITGSGSNPADTVCTVKWFPTMNSMLHS